MVLYFASTAVDPPRTLFMGKDKFENEELIKYGCEEDIWFHVEKLSSAHVYLRLEPGESWETIDQELLKDCAQLTKANSIEGNKRDNISVIYTPWSNLKKTPGMEVGQVGFRKEKLVKRVHVQTRENAIINRLNKTKVEKEVDLRAEHVDRQRQKLHSTKAEQKKALEESLKAERERQEQERLKTYQGTMKPINMRSNQEIMNDYADQETGEVDVNAYEDDFM